MRVAVNIEGHEILFRIPHFDNIDSLEINDLGADALHRGLRFFDNEPKNVIDTRSEDLQKIFRFACTLRLRLPLADDFPSLFAAVDGDRLLIDDSELRSLHVREFDVVDKDIGTV